MLFRTPSYVTTYIYLLWAIAKYEPASEILGNPTTMQVWSAWSDSAKCLLEHSEDHGEFEKLSLNSHSTYKNTEVLVDTEVLLTQLENHFL